MMHRRISHAVNGVRRGLFVLAAAALPALSAHVAAAADQPPIKIGVMFSFSGDNARAGEALNFGIATFQKEHGDTVAGRKIELVRRDTGQMNPETAKRVAQELIINDHVDLIMGIAYSPEAVAVGLVSTEAKMPVFIVNSTTVNIMKDAPYMSRYGMTSGQLTSPLALYAYTHGIRNIYTLESDYSTGIDAGDSFTKAFTALGGKVIGDVRPPLFSKDFTAYIQRVKDAQPKPDGVFAFIPSGSGPAQFMRTWKEMGLDAKGITLIGEGGLVGEDDLLAIGDAAQGLITSFHYSAIHPSALNARFVKDYLAVSGQGIRPDYAALAGYDTLAAIYKVIELQSGKIDPDRTMQLVRGLKLESPRGPIMIDPSTRDIVQNIYIRRTERKDGRMVNTELETYKMVHDPLEKY
jgi:branched-chain amino acid transport system substrate-binding protein